MSFKDLTVVIFGAGVAGALHYGALSKLAVYGRANLDKIFFVDPRGEGCRRLQEVAGGHGLRVFRSFDEMNSQDVIDPITTVACVCTPASSIPGILKEGEAKGLRNFIVEKPFAFQGKDHTLLACLEKLHILKVENYLYSKVHQKMKSYLDAYNARPRLWLSDFSKNRTEHSLAGRASSDQLPTVAIDIETPHQLYMVEDCLGPITRVEGINLWNPESCAETLLGMGGVTVVCEAKNSDCSVVLNSNLASDQDRRFVEILCADSPRISGKFLGVCESGYGLKASVSVEQHGRIVEEEAFDDDDNFFEMYKSFEDRLARRDFTDLSLINGFSRRFNNIRAAALAGFKANETGVSARRSERTILHSWLLHEVISDSEGRKTEAFINFLQKYQYAEIVGTV